MRRSLSSTCTAVAVLVSLALTPTTASADTTTHQPPWDQELCTPLQVSVAHVDVLRTGGCTLSNPLAAVGVVSTKGGDAQCPSGHGGCANVQPYWGAPTDTYDTPSLGDYTITIDGTSGICLKVGLYRGDSQFGQGCDPVVAFDVGGAIRVVVTMTGPGIVRSLTYSSA
jgi:hypothetical protein